MTERISLDGQLAIKCDDGKLLFVNFEKYTTNNRINYTVSGDGVYFKGKTQHLNHNDHIAIAVLANVFEEIKNAHTIITPNSLKYDIDNWFENITVVRESDYFDKPINEEKTDYNFPELWHIIPSRIRSEDDPLTKEEADKIRSDWFTTQRVLWHMKLQKDAGMWSQWTKDKINKDGMSLMDAWRMSNSNQYRFK